MYFVLALLKVALVNFTFNEYMMVMNFACITIFCCLSDELSLIFVDFCDVFFAFFAICVNRPTM